MDSTPRMVVLDGELDVSNAAALRARLDAIPGPAAVIDLSAVTFLDSTALRELSTLRRRIDEVVLIVPSARIRKTLNIVGFERRFRIVESRDALGR